MSRHPRSHGRPFVALALAAATLVGAACRVKVPGEGEPVRGGEYIPCEHSTECPAGDSPCLLAMCLDLQCVLVPAPQGALPAADQIGGDCKQRYCDGNGRVATYANPSDQPASDGNPCTEATCEGEEPKQLSLPVATACGSGGICTGTGICGVCVPGKERCEDHTIATCSDAGKWAAKSPCGGQKPVCNAAKCTGPVELALGKGHACARFDDGAVRCWGANQRGQTGHAGLAEAASAPFAGMSAIATGPRHACGLKGGQVMCWGANDFGQLGGESFVSSNLPAPAKVGPARSVAVGRDHSCALLTSGVVQCWGRNDRGQLGSGKKPKDALPRPAAPPTRRGTSTPKPIAGLGGATRLIVGADHSCAVLDGRASCWGLQRYPLPPPIVPPEPPPADAPKPKPGAPKPEVVDPVAERQKATRWVPTPVAKVSGAKALSCGADHCCAIVGSGDVVCWGAGDRGQIGEGKRRDRFQATKVNGVRGATGLALGDQFGCALVGGGAVACWGDDRLGQLGRKARAAGGIADRAGPVDDVAQAKRLHAGAAFACVEEPPGRIRCWGDNRAGQLGRKVASPGLSGLVAW